MGKMESNDACAGAIVKVTKQSHADLKMVGSAKRAAVGPSVRKYNFRCYQIVHTQMIHSVQAAGLD